LVRQLGICICVAAALSANVRSARAVVKIFDGFGDADVNNNGTPLEPADVDVSGAGTGTVGPYIALNNGGTPMVFPMDTMVPEVTAVESASDVGIRWYSIGGWTGAPTPSPTSTPRASVHILSDAKGVLPETNTSIGYFHSEPGAKRFADAIDNGLALAWETKGRGNAGAGFFNSRVALGPAVNDEVKVSFDFRIWYSAANININTNINEVPSLGEIRFGLYQDTDHQLGQSNPKAGQLASTTVDDPAIWGQANGNFRGDAGASTLAGANGDHGWFVRLPIDDPENSSPSQKDVTTITRINEETNDGATDLRIMNGDTDFVAKPDATFPFMDIDKVYNLSLSLKRYDDPATAGNAGDTIFATATVTDRATGQQYSFGNFEAVGVAAGGDPDGGFESDSWDYFAMTTGGSTDSDDFDWLIDNFKVEVTGSNAGVAGDYNGDGKVDAADYAMWRKNPAGFGGDPAGYTAWRTNFGNPPGSGASLGGSAVPEPASAVLFLLTGLVAFATTGRSAGRRAAG